MFLDPISLVYYAIVCGLLGIFAPRLRTAPIRFATGVVVGLIAAGLLPALRGMIGGG